jgi:hypothetical protein
MPTDEAVFGVRQSSAAFTPAKRGRLIFIPCLSPTFLGHMRPASTLGARYLLRYSEHLSQGALLPCFRPFAGIAPWPADRVLMNLIQPRQIGLLIREPALARLGSCSRIITTSWHIRRLRRPVLDRKPGRRVCFTSGQPSGSITMNGESSAAKAPGDAYSIFAARQKPCGAARFRRVQGRYVSSPCAISRIRKCSGMPCGRDWSTL